jgi:hypothetical protein
VSEPADGFFVSGSSIEGMNGVYIRRNPPRLNKDDSTPSTGASALYYKHEEGLWAMTLNELPPRSDITDDEDERDDSYYFSRYHRKKPETHVWFFEDAFGKQRFQHKGDTIIPGAGTSWKHVPLAGFSVASVDVDSSDEDDRVPSSSFFGSAFTHTKSFQDTSALAEIKEADEEELPWQVIAILDKEMVHQLCYSSEYRKKKVRDAVAGKNAPPPPKNSLEGCFASGCWIFRVTQESILRVSSSEDSEAAGTRHCGEYLRGIKLGGGGDWLCLDSCEDLSADTPPLRHGRRSMDRFFNMELARRQLWVQLKDASGAPRLVEVAQDETPVFELQGVGDVSAAADTESSSTDSSSSTGGVSKVPKERDPEADGGAGLTGDMFDKPFVPRVEGRDATGPSSEQQLLLVTIKGGVEDDVLKQVRLAVEQRHHSSHSVCVVPLGSAVEVYGLVSRSGAPYNGVTGVVVTLAKDGRQGVRLDTPFSGKVLACKVLVQKRTFCLQRSYENG